MRYDLVTGDEAATYAMRHGDTETNSTTDSQAQVITVAHDLAPRLEARHVLYQLLNAIAYELRVPSVVKAEAVNDLVTLLAPRLLALLVGNPDLVEYLRPGHNLYEPPEVLELAGAKWSVILDGPGLADHQASTGEAVFGLTCPAPQRVDIATDGRAPMSVADTVLHEALHVCLRTGGTPDPGDEVDVEEAVVTNLAPWLLHAFRADPALLKRLVI